MMKCFLHCFVRHLHTADEPKLAPYPKRLAEAKNMALVKGGGEGPAKPVGGVRLMPLHGERTSIFRGTNLSKLGVPDEALPIKDHPYKGMKGYTVYSPNGSET